uniref:Uncharacterized protein n=1 Tax=Trypanosoma congolense (strain IL3000) TaxID=1068625 RepID=G0UPK5_TRYCI|nr:conserved hypothetical protein [Trypanosoma congolense IL3000]
MGKRPRSSSVPLNENVVDPGEQENIDGEKNGNNIVTEDNDDMEYKSEPASDQEEALDNAEVEGYEEEEEEEGEPEGPEDVGCEMLQLGTCIWNNVGMTLYMCMLKQLHYTCGCIAMERSLEKRRSLLNDLRSRINTFWELEPSRANVSDTECLDEYFNSQMDDLWTSLTSLAKSSMSAGELCRHFLATLTSFGFPEEDSCDEAQLQANIRKLADVQCYSYQYRTSNQLGVLRRYEGDRRSEEQHLQPRVGRVVRFPIPHPHAEVNTRVQLIEPRRRRPPLEETRIFSHPKRATLFGMEDVLVDEELQFRTLVILGRHLDTFGSLQYLSPYLRLTVWNLLDRDEELFDRLSEEPRSESEAAEHMQHIVELRQRVARKRAAFEATRGSARECVMRLVWSATSAHWRDQVLCVIEEKEDADWCLLRGSATVGTRAIFPNYAACSTVRDIALKALRRVRDGTIDCAGVEDAEECYEVVVNVLVPILEGSRPTLPLIDLRDDEDKEEEKEEEDNANSFEKGNQKQRQRSPYEELVDRFNFLFSNQLALGSACIDVAHKIRWNLNYDFFSVEKGVACTFLTGMFVWPLQCLASFLELVAAGRHSADGLRKFSSAFIPSNWCEEKGILEYLVKREPTNIPLTAFAAFPRLVRDVYTSAQWLRKDKCYNAVMVCRHQAFTLPPDNPALNFMQWKVLSTVLSQDGHGEELLALTVRDCSPSDEKEGKLWTVAELQPTSKAWVEGMQRIMAVDNVNPCSASAATP